MSTDQWHLDRDVAASYAEGRVTPVLAASVEQHLLRCAACRTLLPADEVRLDVVWDGILERVEAPAATPLERVLLRLGVDEGTARLMATTPSLRSGWLAGVVVVLALALVGAQSDDAGTAVFMALAPILPIAGVALAFGPRADPAHEIVAATPHSAFHLLSVRTALVVATTLLPATALTPLLPHQGWAAVAWLVPGLALTASTLALSTKVAPHVAAIGLGVLWFSLVLAGYARSQDPLLAAHPVVQILGVAALAAAVIDLGTRRHEVFEALRRNA